MKKIFLNIFLISSILFTTSCDNKFEEINISPNDPTVVPAHLFLGNVIRENQNNIYDMFAGGDMGMCWAQHVSKVQYNDEERYRPRQGSINTLWNELYTKVLYDAQSMYDFAILEGNTNIQGISLVLQANTFQILTDCFGPIIFSEFNSGFFKPTYDRESDVYAGINQMLIEADNLLANGIGEVPVTSDLIYGGDVVKWRKFANSLRLKVLMRMSKKVNVNSQVSDLVASGNLMTSNDDSAQMIYLQAEPDANPIYETIDINAGARGEWKISSVMVDKLNSYSDPRLAVYAQPVGGTYVGNIPGNDAIAADVSAIGTFYLNPRLPGVFMSYAQVEFLLAEAYNEGILPLSLTDAKTHYVNAINANFEFNGLVPSTSYTSSAAVDFTTQTEAREKIATQEWIALFGQGIEAWTEWRRTGFPVLSPVNNAVITSIPKRYFYSSQEPSVNNANYQAASAMLANGDQLTSPLWWMN